MCGIVGVYGPRVPHDRRLKYLRRMLGYLRHRGPDEMGYYSDETVVLGTARLRIVDLQTGQQPIVDRSGRYVLIFNGEIYNYEALRSELLGAGSTFTTGSDTEVLLNAWIAYGQGALSKFNGAFAFAIYDRNERSLVLARDRFGKRPLYFTTECGHVAFASEMKALLAFEPFSFSFDNEQLASIYRIWTPLEHQSGFRGIEQVPLGSYVVVKDGHTATFSYGTLDLRQPSRLQSEGDAVEQVRHALIESVKERMPREVGAGVYVSGGIDSSIIASLAANCVSGPLKTFSVTFDDDEFDESADQRAIVSHFGTDHCSVEITSADIVESLPKALWHAEVPVFRTAFVPMFLLSQTVRSCGVKVVLTGEGADEVFLGYDLFKEVLLREMWQSLDLDGRKDRLRRLYPYVRHFGERNLTSLYGLFSQMGRQPSSEFFSHELRFRNSHIATRLLAEKSDSLAALATHVRQDDRYRALNVVQRAQWLEFKTLLSGYLLSTQGDRMCMAHGVENRCPFLDPKVVAVGLATNLNFNDGWNEKYLLKQAFKERLPASVVRKHKHPYRAPDASAFIRCKPDYLELLQSTAALHDVGLLDVPFCAAFVKKVLAQPYGSVGQADNQAFMLLLSTVLLHRQFVRRGATEPAEIDSLLVRQIDGRIAA